MDKGVKEPTTSILPVEVIGSSPAEGSVSNPSRRLILAALLGSVAAHGILFLLPLAGSFGGNAPAHAIEVQFAEALPPPPAPSPVTIKEEKPPETKKKAPENKPADEPEGAPGVINLSDPDIAFPYPEAALVAGVSGRVDLEITLNAKGEVKDIVVLGGENENYFSTIVRSVLLTKHFPPPGKTKKFRGSIEFSNPLGGGRRGE